MLPEGVIPRSRVSIAGVSSEEAPGDAAAKAIDGNPGTFWHTRWSQSPVPAYLHWITLDLGTAHQVDGLGHLPRQDGANGRIKDDEVHLSADNQSWGAPVAKGTFPTEAEASKVTFLATSARYIRLVGLSAQNGLSFGGAAEPTVHGRGA